MKWKQAIVLCAALVLAGCGGPSTNNGGGNPPTPPAPTFSAEGVYVGANSVGATVDALVLDDGSFWQLYGVPSRTALVVQGISRGQLSAGNGTFTANVTDFPAPGDTPLNAQISGNYVAGTSLLGSFTEGGATNTFSLMTPVAATYNYAVPASMASIAGVWSGSLLNGELTNIAITESGTVSGFAALGCTFTGSAAVRPGGKNVFDMAFSFAGFPCTAANQTFLGVGLIFPLGNGANQLLVAVTNSTRTQANAFFAQR